jgi:hypothetical protein
VTNSGEARAFRDLTAVERLEVWNRQLVEHLFPRQATAGTPALFACDDEAIRTVGVALGLSAEEALTDLARAVVVAFDVGKTVGLQRAYAAGARFAAESRPRSTPSFVGVLALCVLAATRMAPDQKNATHAYYPRLFEILPRLGPAPHQPPGFEYVPHLFAALAEWLEVDEQLARGRLLIAPDDTHPAFVGACVFQTVFRERDRQLLSRFFNDRLRHADGFDTLLVLRRWSGRHQLTHHAQQLIDDDQVGDRVRAALTAAHALWDGSVLLEDGGRIWPGTVYLSQMPLTLRVGASNSEAISFRLDSAKCELRPHGEVELPLTLLDTAADRGLLLGDPHSAAGAVRLARLGDSVTFELADRGLQRVAAPIGDTVWVLTRRADLVARLATHRLNDRGQLPPRWALLRKVPVGELDPLLSSDPETGEAVAPLRVDSGLSVERRAFLQGIPPVLIAGDLEGDELNVSVNGANVGTIRSQGTLVLPADQPGSYRLDAGDGLFTVEYHVEERGARQGYDRLRFDLGADRVLRAGASPITEPRGTVVAGALVDPSPDWQLPILVRRSAEHLTLDAHGSLRRHTRPATPSWYRRVGLDRAGRWEIEDNGVIWLLCPEWREARLWRDLPIEALSADAASVVTSLALDGVRLRSRRGLPSPDARWQELRLMADRRGPA